MFWAGITSRFLYSMMIKPPTDMEPAKTGCRSGVDSSSPSLYTFWIFSLRESLLPSQTIHVYSHHIPCYLGFKNDKIYIVLCIYTRFVCCATVCVLKASWLGCGIVRRRWMSCYVNVHNWLGRLGFISLELNTTNIKTKHENNYGKQ